jgi:N-glycosidase YbiA
MILFYRIEDEPYGCFSNLSPHGVQLAGDWWPTVEHYFQAQKFVGTRYEEMIRCTEDPYFVADVGKWQQLPLRPDWEQVKDDVMYRAVLCKFETHADIRQILLSTGNEFIVENAPDDFYWGCGHDGSGKNRLGQILMGVRNVLRIAVQVRTQEQVNSSRQV